MKNLVIILFVVTFIQKSSFSQLQGLDRIDSLLNELPQAMEDTNKVKILNDLSFFYKSISPDEGLKYGMQALLLSEKLKYKNGIAKANTMMGLNYYFRSDYLRSLDFFKKAMVIFQEQNDIKSISEGVLYDGTVYHQQGNYAKALENDLRALKAEEEFGNPKRIAKVEWEIGQVYMEITEYSKSMEYLIKALMIFEKVNDKEGISNALKGIGEVYYLKKEYSKAMEFAQRALQLAEKLGDKSIIAISLVDIGNVYEDRGDFPNALKYFNKSLKINEELGNKYFIDHSLGNIGEVYLYIAKSKSVEREKILPDSLRNKVIVLHKAISYLNKCIEIAKEIGDIYALQYFFSDLTNALALSGNYKEAYESYRNYTIYHDSAYSLESKDKISFLETENAKELKQKESEIQKHRILLSQYEKYGLLAGLCFMGIIAFGYYRSLRRKKRDNLLIGREKGRAEELLLNILPYEVAEELKETGHCQARTFSMVTVMFADFKDFTNVSEKVSAELLVDEINFCFSTFDRIIQKYKIEKIKTVGDAYICASGLPVLNYTHSSDMVSAAIELRNFMLARKIEKEARGELPFELRIGIHTGPVVAGIVGLKKFQYDIWGDTVNLAARMESSCEAGQINISGTTFALVKDKFNCTHRGKIEAKHKGEVDMYFVESFKTSQLRVPFVNHQ